MSRIGKKECDPRTYPEPHIGISKDTELDQDDQRQCQKNQDRKKSRRQRQIVNLGIVHEIEGLV